MTIPTKILHSTTAGNKPSSLATGQLAINEADRLLYYLDPTAAAPASLLDQLSILTPANNLVINGAMEVDQINFGSLVSGVVSTTKYAVDMAKIATPTGTQTITTQQVSDAPFGFANSLKFSVTSANASPGSTDSCAFQFPVEGYRVSRLRFGAVGASSISVGFWVKAFRAGVYGVSVSNGANNRNYSTSFTIVSSAVWQWVSVAIPGDITGTWGTTTGVGLLISIFMMAGTSLKMTPNLWAVNVAGGVVGQVNGVQTTSDFMQITGVCAFPGYVAPQAARTPINLPFPETLQQCYRFYQKSYDYGTALASLTLVGAVTFQVADTATFDTVYIYFVGGPMATIPSITTWSPNTGTSGQSHTYTTTQDISSVITNVGTKGYLNTPVTAGTSPLNVSWHWAADARL